MGATGFLLPKGRPSLLPKVGGARLRGGLAQARSPASKPGGRGGLACRGGNCAKGWEERRANKSHKAAASPRNECQAREGGEGGGGQPGSRGSSFPRQAFRTWTPRDCPLPGAGLHLLPYSRHPQTPSSLTHQAFSSFSASRFREPAPCPPPGAEGRAGRWQRPWS